MKATKIKSLALGLLVALAGLSACISYDNQDQYCDEGANPSNLYDACPYGPPVGPEFANRNECDLIKLTLPPGDVQCNAASSWATHVWPKLAPACATAGCHLDGVKGITLRPEDGPGSYKVLKEYRGASDRFYIDPEAPAKAWILCNINGTKDGGVKMPPGPLMPDVQKTLELWLQCGQKL